MKLVIHIGSHKAGSTSIQDYCFLNQDQLLGHGICYPTGFFKNSRQHSALRVLIAQDRVDDVRVFLDHAVGTARAMGADTVFLSGEDMTAIGPMRARGFQALAAEHFEQTQIVLIIRNKRDFYYSLYRHNLRYGPLTGEGDFATRQSFSPRACVDTWRNIPNLGLKLISFEATKSKFLSTFFREVFGFDVPDGIVSNRSIDYLTLQIMNSYLKGQGDEVEKIWSAVNMRHSIDFTLPIEDVIAANVDRLYPDEDWQIPGLDLGPAILEKRKRHTGDIDNVRLCRKMVDLFTELLNHFEQGKAKQ